MLLIELAIAKQTKKECLHNNHTILFNWTATNDEWENVGRFRQFICCVHYFHTCFRSIWLDILYARIPSYKFYVYNKESDEEFSQKKEHVAGNSVNLYIRWQYINQCSSTCTMFSVQCSVYKRIVAWWCNDFASQNNKSEWNPANHNLNIFNKDFPLEMLFKMSE